MWDGLVYQGNILIYEYKNGKRNIKSSCTESNDGWYNCPSGNRFKPLDTGYFDKNGRQGMFKYEFKGGSIHVGEYKDSKRHGQGTYHYFNGDKYIGGWEKNKKHGHGTYIDANRNKYVGQYKYGLRNGQGTLTWADGIVEEGIWNNGEFMYAKKPTSTPTPNSKIEGYKNFCSEIGFTPGTEKFGECVVEAMKKG